MQKFSNNKMYQEKQISHSLYTPQTIEEYHLGQFVLFLVVLIAVILQSFG